MADASKEVKKLLDKKDHNYTQDDWDGIYDARALAKYYELKADESRMARAKLWAKALFIKEQKGADAMKKAAK